MKDRGDGRIDECARLLAECEEQRRALKSYLQGLQSFTSAAGSASESLKHLLAPAASFLAAATAVLALFRGGRAWRSMGRAALIVSLAGRLIGRVPRSSKNDHSAIGSSS